VDPSEPAASEPAAEAPMAAPSDRLVLLVDDDENIRSLLEMSLEMEGFKIITAGNGLEAQKKLADKSPDLIITDLMMPGQGGYEFLRELQAQGGGRTPIFVVSASKLDSSTINMIRAEANVVEFVPKPIAMALFLANVHKVLKTAPPQRESTSRGINDRAA
jgi:two-component system KDP operon response regulator KdpE